MSNNTILILGSTGQLGTALQRTFAAHGNRRVEALSHRDLEITDPGAVNQVLGRVRPGVVINCTAYNWVDAAEEDPRPAFAINAAAVAALAKACHQNESRLFHFSTDYVFDGKSDRPYTEEDPPAPLGLYGLSKWAGERAVRLLHPRHCLIRTGGLYGHARSPNGKANFAEAILAKARKGDPLCVRNDLICAPTSAADLADAVCQLIDREATGTFHVANSGQCSWHEFAGEILRLTGVQANIAATAESTPRAGAARPRYAILGCDKLGSFGIHPLPSWREAIAAYLRNRSAERFG